HPASGPGVRDDSGVYSGYTVPRYYDTLLAKLVVWGPDRDAAIARMARALAEYRVVGVTTTIPLLLQIMGDEAFAAGRLSTPSHARRRAPAAPAARNNNRRAIALIAAAIAAYERAGKQSETPSPAAARMSGWRWAGWPGWGAR